MRDAQEASDEAREFPISRGTEETTDTRRFFYFFFFSSTWKISRGWSCGLRAGEMLYLVDGLVDFERRINGESDDTIKEHAERRFLFVL